MFDNVPGMEHEGRDDRDYWLKVAIDGTIRTLRIKAPSAEEARRWPHADLHRGARMDYQTPHGEITVEWTNVATLEVGPILDAD